MEAAATEKLVDGLGRRISYLRLSVTDRCDMRCDYCMAESQNFMPRNNLMTGDELVAIAEHFIQRGISKIRLTGGEPLVRGDIVSIAGRLGRYLGVGLDELTLTTNGSQLRRYADPLRDAGIRRINVSLDSLNAERFRAITRHGSLDRVLDGIAAAKAAGLAIRINMVAMRGVNTDEIVTLLRWCADHAFSLAVIETMPLGDIGADRNARFQPLTEVRAMLEENFTLLPAANVTGGPARYWHVKELDALIGFISPLTQNFCAGCNRVRVTATGMLHSCLGDEYGVDLRSALARSDLDTVIDAALARKRERHHFDNAAPRPAVQRTMSVTGG